MTKHSQIVYKFLYFFLATIPQFIAVLFSISITKNLMDILRDSSDRNQVYLLALTGALIWAILLVILRFSGAFSNMGINLRDFRADILRILGYSFLAGVMLGIFLSVW